MEWAVAQGADVVNLSLGTTDMPGIDPLAVDGTHLSLEHPAEPGSVSLRAELTDDSGNTLIQTIERAYLTTR